MLKSLVGNTLAQPDQQQLPRAKIEGAKLPIQIAPSIHTLNSCFDDKHAVRDDRDSLPLTCCWAI
jgi:hypothetical protein